MIHIKEVARIEIAMIEDRGVKKMRVNMYKDGKLTGFMRPVHPFPPSGDGDENPGDPKPKLSFRGL